MNTLCRSSAGRLGPSLPVYLTPASGAEEMRRCVPRLIPALILVIWTVGALAGCSNPVRLSAVPQDDTTLAQIPGIPNARYFADTQIDLVAQETLAARNREAAALAEDGFMGPLPEADILAVSGGGADGAFGAGILTGWTTTGTRPTFKLVTGISTGALTAPFAFLGSSWDPQLIAVYTEVKPSNIFRKRYLTAAIWNDALLDTDPLGELIARYANQAMLDAIAREYARGRLLLIGTTNLDAGRPVIWNIGAIAASHQPNALDLVRKVLRASAAIPGAFPPVLIDVEINGKHYQEMHVDGGAIAQMFLYPAALVHAEVLRKLKPRPLRAWLIRNSRLDPDWATVERSTMSIAQEAIGTMIQVSGMNDVSRIYMTALRDHVDYNLAYIGADFTMKPAENFDPAYMRALYNYGRNEALSGRAWVKRPPWVPKEETVFGAAPRKTSAVAR